MSEDIDNNATSKLSTVGLNNHQFEFEEGQDFEDAAMVSSNHVLILQSLSKAMQGSYDDDKASIITYKHLTASVTSLGVSFHWSQ